MPKHKEVKKPENKETLLLKNSERMSKWILILDFHPGMSTDFWF
jgi:hypothetical protein